MQREFHVRHFVYREGFNPVFVSQVIRPAEWLVSRGMTCKVGVFGTLGEFLRPSAKKRWDGILEQCSAGGARIHRLPCLRGRGAMEAAAALLRLVLRTELRAGKCLVLHCRNEIMTLIALQLRRHYANVRVICDYRGIGHAEQSYAAREDSKEVRKETLRLFKVECTATREADAVICVSSAMKDYVRSDYDVPDSRQIVIPCCPDIKAFERAVETRAAIRTRLGIADRFVVTYSGSLSAWQLPNACIDLFCAIQKHFPNAHFLALTTDDASMNRLIAEKGLSSKQVSVLRLRHTEVPSHLAAADVGLLLREPSLVNRVSSPVKFGEYLAAGVPVIMSEGVGDYSALAASERVGMVLDTRMQQQTEELAASVRDFVQRCQLEGEGLRSRCRAVVRQHLTWDAHLPKLMHLYEALASGVVQ